MVNGIILTEKTKEELIEIILEEREQRVELEKKIKELEEKVKAEQKKRIEKFIKVDTKKRKKRPGRKKGHVGVTRHPPEEIDEIVDETLEECPCCQGGLVLLGVEEEVQEEERNMYLQIYNETYNDTFPQSLRDSITAKRLCIMMASAAGAEGISLMNTRNVYIMEPYWNPARIDQVIGRAIRINSHKNLPENERNVKVQMYMSVFSPEQSVTAEGPNIVSIRRNDMILKRYEGETPQETFMTSDEFLYEVAFEKTRIIKQVTHLLKQSAIDCEIHRKLHASERPVVQCMRFDTTYTPDELGYLPSTLAEERDVMHAKNIIRKSRRLQRVQVKGILLIIDPDTFEVFDAPIFEDSKRLLKIGMRTPNSIRFFTSVES